jgi:hypothetical protein
MAHDKHADKYTNPELREQIKQELMASDKGGKPGQWSARKSQMLAREYEKRGGGYKGPKDEAAKSLEAWTEQDWQTQAGDDKARKDDKTSRYLPKEVWDQLSPEEKKEAEKTKVKGSKHGEQHVAYTPAVKRAMHQVGHKGGDREATKTQLLEQAKKLDIKGRSRMKKEELEKAIQRAAKP